MRNPFSTENGPIFLYAVPHSDPLFDELSSYVAGLGDSIRFGLVADLSGKGPRAVRTTFQRYKDVDLRIADPMLHRIDAPYVKEGRISRRGNGYETRVPRPGGGLDMMLAQEIPVSSAIDQRSSRIWSSRPDSGSRDAWIANQLDVQRAAGATVLLSAGGWVSTLGPQGSIKRAILDIESSRAAIAQDESMACALTMHHQWLASPDLLSALLTEVRATEEPAWYLRFVAPKTDTGSQVFAPDVLKGLRRLIEAMTEEEKSVVFPDFDLLGLVAVALGAAGFSTTTSASRRYYIPSGGGTSREKERVFEPEILRVVTRVPADVLRSRPRSQWYFSTPFHQEIDAPGFDKVRSKYDHVASAMTLLAELAGPEGRDSLFARLSFGATIAEQVLDRGTEDFPGHLRPWREVLVS